MAAEVVAGAWAAEEVVSTTAQLGVAAYMVSKPTVPLKATFSQIASAPDDGTKASLARSNHSLTIVQNKAYIFGGQISNDNLASNDIHVISLTPQHEAEEKGEQQYALLPAVQEGETGGESNDADGVPSPRAHHAACALNVCVAVFSGVGADNEVLNENGRIWLFNTAKSAWEALDPKVSSTEEILTVGGSPKAQIPEPRANGKLFHLDNNLVLYGGFSSSKEPLKDTWHFSYPSRTWTRLPDAPVATTNAALADGTLHLLSSPGPKDAHLTGAIHSLTISTDPSKPASWISAIFPTNPLTPAPAPRVSGGLLPISTGHGRYYLLHFFGTTATPPASSSDTPAPSDSKISPDAPPTEQTPHNASSEKQQEQPQQFPDLWTLQLPSTPTHTDPSTGRPRKPTLTESLRPAAIKDTIRHAFGAETGVNAWAEVDVLPPSMEALGHEMSGKVHPGPRAWFGCDVVRQEREGGVAGVMRVGERVKVVLWGGVNAKGEREGDGWVIGIE